MKEKIEIALKEQNVKREEDLNIWKTHSYIKGYVEYYGTSGTINYISIYGQVIGIEFQNLEKGVKPEDYFPKIYKGEQIIDVSYHLLHDELQILVFNIKCKNGHTRKFLISGYKTLYTINFKISSPKELIKTNEDFKDNKWAYIISHNYENSKYSSYKELYLQPLGQDLEMWFDYMSNSKIFDEAHSIISGYEFIGTDSSGNILRVLLTCGYVKELYGYGVLGVQTYKNYIAQQCIEADVCLVNKYTEHIIS